MGARRARLLWPAAIAVASVAILMLEGCSASAPRFRGNDVDEGDDEHEIRFATRIREEERREDDRRADPSRLMRKPHPVISPSDRENETPAGIARDRFLLETVSYLGVPYAYGGTTRDGMDCSGFTSSVYRTGAQISLPRSTTGQFRTGAEVEPDSLLFGDLVFFNTTGRVPSHVGIYLEDGLFAHASVTYGVTISSLESTYYRNRYIGARRVAGAGSARGNGGTR